MSEQEQTFAEILSHLAERKTRLSINDHMVQYHEAWDDTLRVRIGDEEVYSEDSVDITPSEALKLLDWLTQEKPVLELLARAQEESV